MSSLFIAIEGPNGVGTKEVSRILADQLWHQSRFPVHLTTEPTATELGRMLRRAEAALQGRAFALAIAADRAAHLDTEIIPRLDDGFHVITDRYVQSSLVLHRIDGLTIDEIWAYNQYVLPAVTIYLEEDPDLIRERLNCRPRLTRLEKTGSPERELELYAEARGLLGQPEHSWTQHVVRCRNRSPESIAGEILNLLPFAE